MKMRKSILIILLYDTLKVKAVKMDEFIKDQGISIPTFKRYITDIREYLCVRNNKEELVYNRPDNSYIIVSND